MGKSVKKVYSVNNLEVELVYRWNSKGKCATITQFMVYYCNINITASIPKKRLSKIVSEITNAIESCSDEVVTESNAA